MTQSSPSSLDSAAAGRRGVLRWLGRILPLLVGVGLGALFFGGEPAAPPASELTPAATKTWTCSMHPQVRLPTSGQCPRCQMDLVPVHAEQGRIEEDTKLVLGASARALAQVRTAPVRRGKAHREVMLVGRVAYDETRVQRVASTVPGRIERLYVEVTGTRVKRGEHLLRLYSSELLAAQNEWLGALAQAQQAPATTAARDILLKTAAAAEERLKLWGMGERQRQRLRESGKAQQTLTVFAPRGGVVVERHAVAGAYVKEGTPLYTVADLERLWVELEAFESDLPHVRFGQVVALATDAMPGRTWSGRVSFVAPIVDERSRTVRVRVNFDNQDGALKPGMLVRASLMAHVDATGHAVSEADLENAWVCPMHPDVVKYTPARCDVCGMKLEAAADLKLVSAERGRRPLLIPASAPLLTGKRAVVYVETSSPDGLAYDGRAVRLGPRVGEEYVVLEGLTEGELVVVEGAFKIDAAMQVKAKPSMMSGLLADSTAATSQPAPSEAAAGDRKPVFRPGTTAEGATPFRASSPAEKHGARVDGGVNRVLVGYLELEEALGRDDEAATRQAGQTLLAVVEQTHMTWPSVWQKRRASLEAASADVREAAGLKDARIAFGRLTAALIEAIDEQGASHRGIHRFYCPMALGGKGAEWLQRDASLTNPYFGSQMLKCGEYRGEVLAR